MHNIKHIIKPSQVYDELDRLNKLKLFIYIQVLKNTTS